MLVILIGFALVPSSAFAQALSASLAMPTEFFLEPRDAQSHLTSLIDFPSSLYKSGRLVGLTIRSDEWVVLGGAEQHDFGPEALSLALVTGSAIRVGAIGVVANERINGDLGFFRGEGKTWRRRYGGGVTLGWKRGSSGAAEVTAVATRRFLEFETTVSGSHYRVRGWGDLGPDLRARVEQQLFGLRFILALRHRENRISLGDLSLTRSDTPPAVTSFGEPLLRDQFVGVSASRFLFKSIQLHAAAWGSRLDDLRVGCTVTDINECTGVFRRNTRSETIKAALGTEIHVGAHFRLRGGAAFGREWSEERGEYYSYGPDILIRQRPFATKNERTGEEFALGLGYVSEGLQVDVRLDPDFDLLDPFVEVDIVIAW